jgi:hypothetical protein
MTKCIRWTVAQRENPSEWNVSVVNPDDDLWNLEEDVGEQVATGTLRIQVDWPLCHQYTETHTRDNFTRGDVARIVCGMYCRYYQLENGVPPGYSPKNNTRSNPFDVANLRLVALHYCEDNNVWRPSCSLQSTRKR